jgi:hypothetical protein
MWFVGRSPGYAGLRPALLTYVGRPAPWWSRGGWSWEWPLQRAISVEWKACGPEARAPRRGPLSLALFQGGGERRGFVEAVPSVYVTQRPGPPWLPPPRVGAVREPPLQGKCAAPWVRGPPARSSGLRGQACSLVVAWRLVLGAASPMGLSRRMEGMRAGGPRTQAWVPLSLALFQSRGDTGLSR